MKKSISILLLLCLFVGMFGGVSVFAAESEAADSSAEIAEASAEAAAAEEGGSTEETAESASDGTMETFTSFSELKNLLTNPGEDGYWMYTGTGPLTISESTTIPNGIRVDMAGQNVTIDTGITLTVVGSISCGEITVNGSLINYGGVSAKKLIGINNVQNDIGREFTIDFSVNSAADLVSALNTDAAAYSAKNIAVTVSLVSDYTQTPPTTEYTLSEAVTVPGGIALKLYASLVLGSGAALTNNGSITLSARDCTTILKLDGGTYAGSGGMLVTGQMMMSVVTDKTEVSQRLPGFDTDKLALNSSDSMWYYVENSLTKLDTPTNLSLVNGIASWTAGTNTSGEYLVTFYRDGESQFYVQTTETSVSMLSCGAQDLLQDNSSYYFTVTALGDFETYTDSDTAQSDPWNYNEPSTALPAPTNAALNLPNASFTKPAASDNADKILGYEIEGLYSIYSAADVGDGFTYVSTGSSCSIADVLEWLGVGYYKIRVRTLSNDISAIKNSEWSDYSTPCYFGIAELLQLYASLDTLPEETRARLQDAAAIYATDDNPDNTDMTELLEDDTTRSYVSEIDEALGGVDIKVAEGVDINENLVTIVGGAINTPSDDEESITLEIGQADNTIETPEEYSTALTVRFAMTMENIDDAENLEFPVWVQLPVPENMDPNELVILHYHIDGEVEEVDYTLSEEDGKWYASFVLTSFSDFSIGGTEAKAVDSKDENKPGSKQNDSPHTGDDSALLLWAVTGLTAACALLYVGRKRKN